MSRAPRPKTERHPNPASVQIAQEAQSAKTMFLDPKTYRRRRLMDAMRVLPVLGVVLWMIPLLWSSGEGATAPGAVPMSSALLYIFVVWGALILVGFALWVRVGPTKPEDSAPRTATRMPDQSAERNSPWPR